MTQHRGSPSEDEYYNDLLGEKGNPDFYKPANIRYIGQDKAVIERQPIFNGMHWSEQLALGYKVEPLSPKVYGDNDKSDPFNNIDSEE